MLKKLFRRRPLIEELEPRILFSADLAPLAFDSLQPAPEQRVINADGEFSSVAVTTRNELVIVDTRVTDYETLLADILNQSGNDRHFSVVILDAEQDGIAQISDALKHYDNLDAVHLITHGESGTLQLGSNRLDAASLSDRASEIGGWARAFTDDADLLLYGCDVASDAKGEAFLVTLSQLTRADVAASSDLTGHAALGGNWVLEYSNGAIESSIALSAAAQANWQGVLVAPTLLETKTPLVILAQQVTVATPFTPTGSVGIKVKDLVDTVDGSGRDNVIDPDGPALGIAIIGTNTSNGTLYFSQDNGSSWTQINAVSSSNAFLLPDDATTRLYFQPSQNYTGYITDAVTFKAWDQSSGSAYNYTDTTSGGMPGAVSSAQKNIAVEITASGLNAAPTASSKDAGETYATNTTLDLTDIIVSDSDSSSVSVTLTLSDTGAGSLTTGTLGATTSTFSFGTWHAKGSLAEVNALLAGVSYVPTAAYSSNFNITVSVSDGLAASVTGLKLITHNAAPVNVQISAAQDTYINNGSTNNYGASTSLVVDRSGGSDLGNGRALLQFDLSSIPVGATITSASLQMQATVNGSAFNINVYRLTEAWVEGNGNGTADAANWTNRLPGTVWTSGPGGTFDPTVLATLNTAAIGQHNWDLTSLVQAWHTGSTANYGIILGSPDTGTTTVSYDSSEGATAPRLAITYTLAPNAAPVVTTSGGALAYTENATATAIAPSLTVTDDGSNLASATVSISANYANGQDVLGFVNQNGISGSWNAGTGVLTLTGSATVANYETALRSVTYANTSEDPSTLARTVSFVVNDGTSSSTAATRTINVAAINDAPVNAVPDTQTTTKNTTLAFSAANGNAFLISDVDAGSAIVQTTLTVSSGLLNAGAGTTGVVVAGSGTGTVTLTGTIAQINNLLAGNLGGTLSFSPVANFTGSVALTFTTNDQNAGASGSGGAKSDTDVVAISVTDASLWLSTVGGANSSAGSGNLSWQDSSVVNFGNPNLSLGSGTTSGTFSIAFNMSALSGDGNVDVKGMHVVSRAVTVGTTVPVNLLAGDVLFSVDDNEIFGGVAVTKRDVVLFRPTTDGDYSSGTFSVLLRNPGGTGEDVRDFALVESAITVGGTPLQAGDFLLLLSGGARDKDVWHFRANATGVATTGAAPTELVNGDAGLIIGAHLVGIELITQPITIGSKALSAGQLLLSLDGNAVIGGLFVQAGDILVLNLLTSGSFSTGTASMLMNASDVGLTGGGETLDALALFQRASSAPVISVDASALAYTENDPATVIAPLATVSDADSTNFGSGSLNVYLSNNGTADDRLAIRHQGNALGQIGVSGSDVLYGGTIIGSFSGGEDGSTPLVVSLNGSATHAATQALLRNITFANVSENPSTLVRTVSVELTDGSGGSSSVVSRDIGITSVNDAPTISAPASIGVTEDVASALSGISFDDVDAGGASVTASLGVGSGTLNAISGGGVTVSGSGTGSLGLVGSITNINAFIAASNVSFTTAANATANVTLNLTIDDGGNTGIDPGTSGTASSEAASGSVTLMVTAVNDPPVLAAIGNQSVNEGSNLTFTASASDIDLPADTLTYTLDAASIALGMSIDSGTGVFSWTPTESQGGLTPSVTVTVTDNGSGTLSDSETFTITVNEVNAAPLGSDGAVTLDEDGIYVFSVGDFGFSDPGDSPANTLQAVMITTLPSVGTLLFDGNPVVAGQVIGVSDIGLSKLTFVPAANANGANYASFTFQVQDTGGVTNGGVNLDPDPKTLTINVTAVNDAPTASGGATLAAIAEDSSAPPGATVGDLFAANFSNPEDAGNALHNQFAGIAVRGQNTVSMATEGRWQYSTDGGTTWSNFGVLSDGNAVSLGLNDTLRFKPVADYNGMPSTLSMRLLDNSVALVSGGLLNVSVNGGITAISSELVLLSTDVTPVNDAPVVSLIDLGSIDEDGSRLITQGDLLAGASDIDADTLTATSLSLTSGSGTLLDHSDGTWTFTPTADWNGTASFSYAVTDGTVSIASSATLVVNPVNDAPQITSADTPSVLEDKPASVMVTATDIESDTLTFSITGGVDAALFSLNPATGELKLIAVPNYEAPQDANRDNIYEVIVTASDGQGGSTSQAIHLVVINVVEAGALPPDAPPTVDQEPSIDETVEQAVALVQAPSVDHLSEQHETSNALDAGTSLYAEIHTAVLKPIQVLFHDTARNIAGRETGSFLTSINQALKSFTSDAYALQLLHNSLDSGSFQQQLNHLQETILQQLRVDKNAVASTLAVTTGLSVGYVLWLVRGGVLLSSLLTSMPAWRLIDPLPILGSLRKREDGEHDDDSLEALLKKSNAQPLPASTPDAPAPDGSTS